MGGKVWWGIPITGHGSHPEPIREAPGAESGQSGEQGSAKKSEDSAGEIDARGGKISERVAGRSSSVCMSARGRMEFTLSNCPLRLRAVSMSQRHRTQATFSLSRPLFVASREFHHIHNFPLPSPNSPAMIIFPSFSL